MSYGDGLTEGTGRMLAALTKQEASGVTVAIPQPEHAATLPIAAVMPQDQPRRPSDVKPTDRQIRADVRLERLKARNSSLNSTREDSRKLAIAKETIVQLAATNSEQERGLRRKNAEVSMLVRRTDELIAEKKALEAKLASATKERHIKRNVVVAMLFIATCYLCYDKYLSSRFEDFAIRQQMENPELPKNTMVLEIAPEMEGVGTEKFVPVAQRMPYADDQTIASLLTSLTSKVEQCYDMENDPVVELHKQAGYVDAYGNPVRRVVLVHVFPASIGAYMRAMNKEDGRMNPIVTEADFVNPRSYEMRRRDAVRMLTLSLLPTATHEQLMGVSDMKVIASDDREHTVLLVGPYGTNERLVRLTDTDYARFIDRGWPYACYVSENYTEKQENVSVK